MSLISTLNSNQFITKKAIVGASLVAGCVVLSLLKTSGANPSASVPAPVDAVLGTRLTPNDDIEEIHIIGGGISGLMLATFLKARIAESQKQIVVHVHEASDRLGGIIGSSMLLDSQSNVPIGISETGANGTVWCDEVADLCSLLNLSPLACNSAARSRVFIVRDKKLVQMNFRLFSGFGPLTLWETIKTAVKALWPVNWFEKKLTAESTLRDFGTHYLGQAATDYLLQPLIGGIYGSSIEELGFVPVLKGLSVPLLRGSLLAQASFPWLIISSMFAGKPLPAIAPARPLVVEKKNFGIRRGTLTCFANGMQDLVDGMQSYLGTDAAHLNSPMNDLSGLLAEDGNKKRIIICTPAQSASRLVASLPDLKLTEQQVDDKRTVAKLLDEEVRYVSLAHYTLVFRKDQLLEADNVSRSFGCLVPSCERLQTMGILFNSSIFANRAVDQDQISLTCIVAMDAFQALTVSSISDEPIKKAIEETISQEIDTLLHYAQADAEKRRPVVSKLIIWPQAIPVYSPKLSQQVIPAVNEALKRSFPNINVFGNFTGEVSVRGMCKAAYHWSSLAFPGKK